MSIDINYCDTLLSALSKSYTSGDYVRTFGFASVGDGGAAIYKVVSDAPSGVVNCTFANTSFNCGEGKFYVSGGTIFQLVPQHGKVYAEQFGVLSGAEAFAEGNIKLLKKAVAFATENGCVLTFASGGVYYLNPGSISVPSGMHIDGNGATLHIVGGSGDYINLFNSGSLVDNVTIKNITLIGRKTSVESGYSDQAIHIKCSNLTVQNVSFKYFGYAFHTYGGKNVGNYEVISDGEIKTYAISDIPNKNWLIDSCKTESCVFGIVTSEIDGLAIKDSDISCFLETRDTYHCVYLSSNCSNVRVAGCNLYNVSGDAIHKAYAYPTQKPKFDSSKNHFYTDLSIHNADSALDIGIISQNVMCDNVFATEVEIALQLSGADNCIVSNSYFSQTRPSSEMQAFIYAENACNCWLQNSYVYYWGKHRATTIYSPSAYLRQMFVNKKYRRMYIGQGLEVPNHRLKLTGCQMKSEKEEDKYFCERFDAVSRDRLILQKWQYGEFWDNCILEANGTADEDEALIMLYCINDVPDGITLRNSFFTHKTVASQQPFMFCCKPKTKKNGCTVCNNCLFDEHNKLLPCVRLENNVFNNFGETSKWDKSYICKADSDFSSVDEAIRLSNSYYYNCYRNDETSFVRLEA